MPSHSSRKRRVKRHTGHTRTRKSHKGASRHHRRAAQHKKHKTKHGHKRSKNSHRTGRAAGAKAGRHLNQMHMKKRILHGVAGGFTYSSLNKSPPKPNTKTTARAIGAGVFNAMDDMEDSPFMEDFLDEDMLHAFEEEEVTEDDSDDLLSEATDSDDDSCAEEENGPDEAPPLPSENHFHVLLCHSANTDDVDQVEAYSSILENPPNDMKVLVSSRDFKSECNLSENLRMSVPMCLRTVVFCNQDFIDNELSDFDSAITCILKEEQLRSSVIILHCVDITPPSILDKYTTRINMADSDWPEHLTRLLMSSPTVKDGSPGLGNIGPSAPPLDTPDSPKDDANAGNQDPPKEPLSRRRSKKAKIAEPEADYSNGVIVKQVTACSYSDLEAAAGEQELNACLTYCPQSDFIIPRPEPKYIVPDCLKKRGLQVTELEFTEIIHSLTEASNVTFFQKTVDCSLPCLYLSTIIVGTVVSCLLWFLVVGAVNHYHDSSGAANNAATIFWCFLIFVVFVPTFVALVMLGVVLHLVNYKFLKYRIKIEELNKRLRETNLVLHVRKGYWSCSGKLKLSFIFYNFEECQQTLYCHVHDHMKPSNGTSTPEGEKLLNDSSTIKLDRIMKRVNTLTKKFEWDYFEALATKTLPDVQEKEHRKKGMCFCQYVLYRDRKSQPTSVVEHVKERVGSFKKNALKPSHKRRASRTSSLHYVYAPSTPTPNKYELV